MDRLLLSVLLGLAAGIADIIPMLVQRLPRYSIVAAFVHYFVLAIVIVNVDLPHVPWWLGGGLLGLLTMVPMLIHVGHQDRKPLPAIAINALVFGTLIGLAAHYLN